MKKYPKLMEMALVIDNKGDLTATTVRDQYQVTFSEEGTNHRRTEQQAFAWWLDLLQDLEGKQIVFCSRNETKKAHVTQFVQATARGIDLARDKRHDCIFILYS